MSAWRQKASSRGNGDGFPKAPPGNHPARLVAIIDMGTQENNYNGQVTKSRKAYFCWELVSEPIEGHGRNHVLGTDLTISLNEKAKLRQWIESRVGKQMPEGNEYDISKELGQPCLLNVTEKNGYPKIVGMGSVPKGMTVADPKCELLLWSLEDVPDDGTDPEFPSWLPYHYGTPLIDHVKACEELKRKVTVPAKVAGVTDDNGDIPF